MSREFSIGNKIIGGHHPVFIIAELSANHKQDLNLALETIHAAKECGADAIKLQTYTPDTITLDVKNEYFRIKQGTQWDGKNLYELYQEAYTPWEWHAELFETAAKAGLVCFSSPFDPTAVDLLESLNTPAYKIASFEITDIPLIEYVASKNKPVIISTGIATKEDVQEALNACKRMHNENIALLKCTSSYPAPVEEANLASIPWIQETYGVIPGLSDHSLGNVLPVASVALGAKIIEKHFILDKAIGGPDSGFSLNPAEFGSMTKAVRDAEKAMGQKELFLSEKAKKNREFSRSLFVTENIRMDEAFSLENIRSVRPGFGLPPKYLPEIIGKKATRNLEKGKPLEWDDIKP